MQTPEDPDNLPLDRGTVRNVIELIGRAHRSLFMAATMLDFPGFPPPHKQDGWYLKGVVRSTLFGLQESFDRIREIEAQLLDENKNDDPS